MEAYRQSGGFRPEVVLAEDHDLCIRIAENGWKLERLDVPMTIHDIAMTRFSQWWKRIFRGGYGYAEGILTHGRKPERHYVRDTLSIIAWGGLLPVAAIALAWPTRGLSLLAWAAAAIYLFLKITRYMRKRGLDAKRAQTFAAACVVAKIPQFLGIMKCWIEMLFRVRRRYIIYKT